MAKDILKLYDFLTAAGTYYLATEDEGKPRVRPFGTALLFEGKIYILTSKAKDVSKQIEKNPKFEITAMDSHDRWIRVSGKLVQDNRIEVHNAMLGQYPHLKGLYPVGGEDTNTLYLDEVKAVIYSLNGQHEQLDI